MSHETSLLVGAVGVLLISMTASPAHARGAKPVSPGPNAFGVSNHTAFQKLAREDQEMFPAGRGYTEIKTVKEGTLRPNRRRGNVVAPNPYKKGSTFEFVRGGPTQHAVGRAPWNTMKKPSRAQLEQVLPQVDSLAAKQHFSQRVRLLEILTGVKVEKKAIQLRMAAFAPAPAQ